MQRQEFVVREGITAANFDDEYCAQLMKQRQSIEEAARHDSGCSCFLCLLPRARDKEKIAAQNDMSRKRHAGPIQTKAHRDKDNVYRPDISILLLLIMLDRERIRHQGSFATLMHSGRSVRAKGDLGVLYD